MELDHRGHREATDILTRYYRDQLTRAEVLRIFAGLGMGGAALPWLAACGGGGGGEGAAPPGRKPAKATGKLEFLASSQLLGFWDTTAHTHIAHLRLEPIVFDFLVVPRANKELEPGLATEWQRLDDRTIEFKLRQDVKFHDGHDFTAADVKAAIEYASSPKALTNNWFPLKQQVTGEVVDDYTIRLKTAFPAGGLLYSLSMIPIQSSKDITNPSVFQQRMNGTGPFQWVDFKGESGGIQLTANENYWAGAPLIKDLVYRHVADPSTRLAALQSGEANAIERVEPDQIKVIEANANLAVDRKLVIEQKWFHFKNAVPPFKGNKKLRQALSHAIDRQTIVDKILLGSGKVSDSHLSPEQFLYAPAPNNIPFDLDKAKALLAEAGYPNGNGLPELEYVVSIGSYPKTHEYSQFIIETMAEIGVRLRLSEKEAAPWFECLFIPDCGRTVDSGWFPTTLEPDVVLISQFYKGGIINGIDLPTLNTTLEAESFETDLENRAVVMRDQTIPALMEEVPSFPIFVSELVTGLSSKLKGFDQRGSGQFFVKDAYIEQ